MTRHSPLTAARVCDGKGGNYIRTGNPNDGMLPQWPAVKANDNTPPVMIIDVESQAIDAQDDARYLFLNRAYGNNK